MWRARSGQRARELRQITPRNSEHSYCAVDELPATKWKLRDRMEERLGVLHARPNNFTARRLSPKSNV